MLKIQWHNGAMESGDAKRRQHIKRADVSNVARRAKLLSPQVKFVHKTRGRCCVLCR